MYSLFYVVSSWFASTYLSDIWHLWTTQECFRNRTQEQVRIHACSTHTHTYIYVYNKCKVANNAEMYLVFYISNPFHSQ